MDYQNLGMPLKDAEFIESMKFGILEVAKIFQSTSTQARTA
jgi:phage portal protein BeeE